MIRPKGPKFSELFVGLPGDVMMFGEDQSKTLEKDLFLFYFFNFPGCGHNSMPK